MANTLDIMINDIKINNDLLRNIYEIAYEYHKGEKRKSGVDFIYHPKNVAEILEKVKCSRPTLAAALLHDVIESKMVKNKIYDNEDKELKQHFTQLFKEIANVYNKYENFFKEKRKIYEEISYILALVFLLTKKENQTYFNYLYDIFYKNEIKIKDLVEDKKPEEIKKEYWEKIINFSFKGKKRRILTTRAIQIKLADMIDNLNSLPIDKFSFQTILYTCYKALLLYTESKRKIKRLGKHEEKYYWKVESLSNHIFEKTINTLNNIEKNIEKKLNKEILQNNKNLLEIYKNKKGFEKVTEPSPNYFDGTLIRYGRLLLNKRNKSNLGFDEINENEILVAIHRDVISLKYFTNLLKKPNFKIKGFNLKNLEKIIKKNENKKIIFR